jgi:hypothetical protein
LNIDSDFFKSVACDSSERSQEVLGTRCSQLCQVDVERSKGLSKNGIDPDKGVKAIYAGSHTASFEALRNHKVDAGAS